MLVHAGRGNCVSCADAGPVFVKLASHWRGDRLANTKTAIKMIRVAARRAARNKPVRTELKTLVKTARTGIAAGDLEQARVDVRDAASALDKAANKGVIHKNAAARRKSRLMKRLAKAESAKA